MIRHQRCSSHRPPVKTPQSVTSPHTENLSRKSLVWNILPVSPFDGTFRGLFFWLAVCFQYFADGWGRGVGQLPATSGQSPVRSEGISLWNWGCQRPCRNLYRIYGTRYNFPLYPALKRWANPFRAYGAGFRAVCSTCGDGPGVATQFRQLGAPLNCHADSAKSEQRRAKSIGKATHAC